ncbi:hypothetical protein C8R47DRAFT_1229345 [Mycena vitilis]|nr:hypothetical protein C8R47DRAFT_1229345 [Mycena vitilis]
MVDQSHLQVREIWRTEYAKHMSQVRAYSARLYVARNLSPRQRARLVERREALRRHILESIDSQTLLYLRSQQINQTAR